MAQSTFERFRSAGLGEKLSSPGVVDALLAAIQSEPSLTFDLLFYAAFATKVYRVMKREGADAQGFVRMQQSFAEAVKAVRTVITKAEGHGFYQASVYTELSQQSMTMLLTLMEDLTIVKEWDAEHLRQRRSST